MATSMQATAKKSTDMQQSPRETEPTLLPPVDVYEDADGLTVLADLPGVSRDRLNIRVDHSTLVIEGDVAFALPEQLEALYADVRASRYVRRFALSEELESEKIQATLKDGVLSVRIPKRPESKPRRIEVQTS